MLLLHALSVYSFEPGASLRLRHRTAMWIPASASAVPKHLATSFVLLRSKPEVVKGDSMRQQLVQQPRYCWRYRTVARYDHGPF